MAIGYALVQYNGQTYSDGTPKLVTLRIKQAMAKLEEALGYNADSLTLEQGCHHDGELSGGTHSRADVFDLSYNDWERKANAMIKLGVIPFVRPYNWDGHAGGAHIHCLVRGSDAFSSQAAAQVTDWDKHLNGLANHAHYDGPWGEVKNFNYDPKWKRDSEHKTVPWPHYGDKGSPKVRDVQNRLHVADFYNGPINGNYDDATKNAIAAFQRSRDNIPGKDGIIGPLTWEALMKLPTQNRQHPKVDAARENIAEAVKDYGADSPRGKPLAGILKSIDDWLNSAQ